MEKLRARKILIVIVCAVVLAVIGGLVALRLMFTSMTEETTDVREYEAVLKRWSPSGLVSQFPPAIPTRARNVHFSALPGLMQGGAHIQLRIQLPAAEILEIENRLRPLATHVLAGSGSMMSDGNGKDLRQQIPPVPFHTAGTHTFPAHYKLYMLRLKDDGGDAAPWNHGSSSGVAVSSAVQEVVYWAESW